MAFMADDYVLCVVVVVVVVVVCMDGRMYSLSIMLFARNWCVAFANKKGC